jgi:aminopeptidase I
MSLRTAAISLPERLSSFANPADFETKRTMSDAEKAFVIGELENQPSLVLCDSCYRDIPDTRTGSLPLQLTSKRSLCSACMVLDSKPEAFTHPFCSFLKENPTIFHSVDYFKEKMISLDYKEVGNSFSAVWLNLALTICA